MTTIKEKVKHTPGPWTYREGMISGGNKIKIAEMDQCHMPNIEHYANAALIAAAPELLEACKKAIIAIEERELTVAIAFLEAAIRKAEGK